MPDRASILVTAQDLTGAALKSVESNLAGVNRAVDRVRDSFGAVLGATGVIAFGNAIVSETKKAEDAVKRLDAVVSAAGRNLGVTRAELQATAQDMMDSTQFDDESVLEAQAVLVKFGNITGDVFRQAIRASADVAAFMGTELPQAAQLLGKALQSPTEGLKALEREFGKLTEGQKENITTLVEQNKTLEAQQAILDIVKGKVGGVAEAMNTGFTKATSDAHKEFSNLLEEIGKTELVGGRLKDTLLGAAQAFRDLQAAIRGDEDPLVAYRKQLQLVQTQIDAMTDQMNKPNAAARAPFVFGASLEIAKGKLQDLQEEAKRLRSLITNVSLSLNDPSNFDARDIRLRTGDLKPTLGGKAPGEGADAFKQLVDQYQRAVAMLGEHTEVEKALALLQTDRYAKLDAGQRKEIVGYAKAIDTKKQYMLLEKIAMDAEYKAAEANAEYLKKQEDELTRLIARWEDMANPAQKFIDEMERLTQAFEDGRVSEETYFGAWLQLSLDISKVLDDVGKKLKEDNDFAKSLGLTFSSAFENAILQGMKLRDVLKGLINDIARIILRKTVTEPMAEGVGGLIKGMFPGTPSDEASSGDFSAGGGFDPADFAEGFASGGGIRPGGSGGTDSQLVMFRKSPWEGVSIGEPGGGSGGMVIQQHIHFSANTPAAVRDAVHAMAPELAEVSKAAAFDAMKRGNRP